MNTIKSDFHLHVCTHKGSYIRAHVFNEFIKRVGEKRLNARLAKHLNIFFAMSFIYSILMEHEFRMFYHRTLKLRKHRILPC